MVMSNLESLLLFATFLMANFVIQQSKHLQMLIQLLITLQDTMCICQTCQREHATEIPSIMVSLLTMTLMYFADMTMAKKKMSKDMVKRLHPTMISLFQISQSLCLAGSKINSLILQMLHGHTLSLKRLSFSIISTIWAILALLLLYLFL